MSTVTNGSMVLFKNGTQTNYNNLGTYDPNTLYFTDDNNLYLGGNLIGSNVKDANYYTEGDDAGKFIVTKVDGTTVTLDFSDIASAEAVGAAISAAISTAKSEAIAAVVGEDDDEWENDKTLYALKAELEGTIAESGVTSLNELTGDVEIVNGSNVTVATVDGKIQISSSYTDTNTVLSTVSSSTLVTGSSTGTTLTLSDNGLTAALADKLEQDDLEEGTGITLTKSDTDNTVTINIAPAVGDTTIGGVKAGTNISIAADGTISSSYTDTNTITTVNGSSGTLTIAGGGDGIDVTTTGTSTVITNTGVTSLEGVTGDIDLVGSGSVSISHDDTAKTITITGVDTTYTNGSGISLSGTTFSTTAPTSAEVTGETDSEDIMTASISGNKLTLNVGALEDRLESLEDWQDDYVAPTIPVSSVNTKTGVVVLSGSDINLGSAIDTTNSLTTSTTVDGAVSGLNTRIKAIETVINTDEEGVIDSYQNIVDFVEGLSDSGDTLKDLIDTASEGLYEVTVDDKTFGGDEDVKDISIVGGGATSVSATTDGVITISSTDTNTTYSAGTGISLTGTTFANTGVLSVGINSGDSEYASVTTTSGAVTIDLDMATGTSTTGDQIAAKSYVDDTVDGLVASVASGTTSQITVTDNSNTNGSVTVSAVLGSSTNTSGLATYETASDLAEAAASAAQAAATLTWSTF